MPRSRPRVSAVYPRVCGGTVNDGNGVGGGQGLSPRVRGNPVVQPDAVNGGGSIPACAGEPASLAASIICWTVYPRVCGGTGCRPSSAPVPPGLSPRVRGNQSSKPLPSGLEGSIPACAGEPPGAPSRRMMRRVYPRVCGGTVPNITIIEQTAGLSPRVRGNLCQSGRGTRCTGSIPACAGEPPGLERRESWVWVYPRVCGGTCGRRRNQSSDDGLSPRVRGNPGGVAGAVAVRGSIPACAGEPTPRPPCPALAMVYPRVCGGTLERLPTPPTPSGLSPRVRGNHRPRIRLTLPRRSIPACAGEPSAGGIRRRRGKVYPRVCGGTRRRFRSINKPEGLSPRVRGNHENRGLLVAADRSIPACAGEPGEGGGRFHSVKVYPRVCGGTKSFNQLGSPP